MRKPKVRVELVGGVGNQLFQYFAGRALAEKKYAQLEIDTSLIGVNGTKHASSLKEINFDFEERYSDIKRLLNETIFGRANGWFIRKSNLYRLIYFNTTNRYQSNVQGYDPSLLFLNPPVSISGYYQTRKYFDYVMNRNHLEISLKDKSEWFRELSAQISFGHVIGLHVRRGDYTELSSSFGLLSKDYYLAAINKAKEHCIFKEIWVFSDEIEVAKKLLTGIEGVRFIEPPKESTHVESLFIMSECQALIISNSTFAWWSGVLGKKKQVFYPETWFKAAKYSSDLILDEWTPVPSYWED